MRLIKRTEEYVVDTEEQAITAIQNFRDEATQNGYVLGASGYTLKEKKSKGEVLYIEYKVTIEKTFE